MSSVTCPETIRCNDLSPRVVVYHHISHDKDCLVRHLGVTTSPETFRKHLAYYSRNYDIICEADLLGGKLPRRALLITFDDLYRSVLDVAGPLLREASAPALLFVNPASIMHHTIPFDNLISLAYERLGAGQMMSLLGQARAAPLTAPQIIAQLVCLLRPDQVLSLRAEIIKALGTTESDLWASTRLFMTERDLSGLGHCGVDIGNHSMRHMFFRSLAGGEIVSEIAGGKSVLEKIINRSIYSLSVPYGSECDATSDALAIARMSGHRAIFLVHGRCNRKRPVPDVFYRTSPRGVSASVLPLVIEGLPLLRSLWARGRTVSLAANRVVPAC